MQTEKENGIGIDLEDAEAFLNQYNEDSKLFFYIQVMIKLFKIDKIELEKLNTILNTGADINYLTQMEENVLFKVI